MQPRLAIVAGFTLLATLAPSPALSLRSAIVITDGGIDHLFEVLREKNA